MSFWQGFKYVVKAKTYLLLLNPILWVWMGLAIVQNVYLLYMKYVLNREGQFVIFLVRTTPVTSHPMHCSRR